MGLLRIKKVSIWKSFGCVTEKNIEVPIGLEHRYMYAGLTLALVAPLHTANK